MIRSSRGRTALSWSLVLLQFILLGLLLWQSRPTALNWPALVFIVAGAVLGVWAIRAMRPGHFNVRPDIKPGAAMVSHAPYALIRHPMYSAVLLFCAGLALAPFSLAKLCLWLLLLLVLVSKSVYEESLLQAHFPGYTDYRQRTWRFIPYLF